MDIATLLSQGAWLYAQTMQEGGAPPSPASGLTSMLPLIVGTIAIMYFVMFRPQQKREQERRQMLAALAKGDKVVTAGGVCGTIVGMSEDRVVLKVDDNTKIEFLKSSIAYKDTGDGSKKQG